MHLFRHFDFPVLSRTSQGFEPQVIAFLESHVDQNSAPSTARSFVLNTFIYLIGIMNELQ